MIREHYVKPGETLVDLAQHYYHVHSKEDRVKYALVIWQHNREQIIDPNNLQVGVCLAIPHLQAHLMSRLVHHVV